MAQARRQGKGKKKSARTTGTGASWGMLLVGLVSGAVLAALFMGVRDGDYGQLGSGLKSLWQSNSAATPMEASKREKDTERPVAGGKKPKLDFYTVLPEIERVMPESDFVTKAEQRPLRTSSVYMLQAASYRSFAEADNLKAKLALAGYEAEVQRVTIQGKGVFHRVRLGPFPDKRKLKSARQALAKLGIDALPLSLSTQ